MDGDYSYVDQSSGVNYSSGVPDLSTGVDYSSGAPGDYSGAPGGHNESYDQHHEYNSQGQQQGSGNQQSGGGGGGGGTMEFSVEASVEVSQDPPQRGAQYYQQQGTYAPQPAGYPPPPAYNPTYRPPPNQSYPPPRRQNPPAPVYPPNPTPAPVNAQGQKFPHDSGHGSVPQNQQAFTPVRAPPTVGGALGHPVPLVQALIRPEIGPPEPWTTELFGFVEDCYGCPLVVLAPCIAFGQIAEIVDTGYNRCQTAGIIYGLACSLGIPCLYSYTYRTKMRHRFNLREDPLDDLCTHCWCELCALAQEYREIRYRGIDPSLGYDMQRDTIKRAMEAPVPPRMQANGHPQADQPHVHKAG